jgi:D-psicose/D-tagatose/L-ribulose 3-epimerase
MSDERNAVPPPLLGRPENCGEVTAASASARLSISNIAWPNEEDVAIALLLAQRGIAGIEVAPTKIWPAPLETTDRQVDDYRAWWESRGIRIVAAQALLFGRPDLKLFEGAAVRAQTLEYIRGIARICARLGAGALVFGSPRNRIVGPMDRDAAWRIAVDSFGALGEACASIGTTLVVEANPTQYSADFITRAAEAIALVREVDHPGFRLHLDSACMALVGDDVEATVGAGAAYLRHVHISEPNLAPLTAGSSHQSQLAAKLRQVAYPHFCSLEIRQPEPFRIETIADSLDKMMRL